jgi:hypothetical protein
MLRKIFILIFTASSLMSCDRTANWTTIDFLSGTWEGQEITNYIKIQSYPGALTPHSTAHLLNQIDTANTTSSIDSAGIVIDENIFVLLGEDKISITGTDKTIDWSFDTESIPPGLEPIFDSLRILFSGEQTFDIQLLNRKECVLYFDTVVPVYYAGSLVNVELRHTQYWKK